MADLNLTEREKNFFLRDLEVPFFAWQCFSIICENRTLDFQIEKKKDFFTFALLVKSIVNKNLFGTYLIREEAEAF